MRPAGRERRRRERGKEKERERKEAGEEEEEKEEKEKEKKRRRVAAVARRPPAAWPQGARWRAGHLGAPAHRRQGRRRSVAYRERLWGETVRER